MCLYGTSMAYVLPAGYVQCLLLATVLRLLLSCHVCIASQYQAEVAAGVTASLRSHSSGLLVPALTQNFCTVRAGTYRTTLPSATLFPTFQSWSTLPPATSQMLTCSLRPVVPQFWYASCLVRLHCHCCWVGHVYVSLAECKILCANLVSTRQARMQLMGQPNLRSLG